MAISANGEGVPFTNQDSPLEVAKRLVAPMCHQPKEAHWLGVRMENFLKAYGKNAATVSAGDICDYLKGLMQKGQVEWQVKPSLDAIGLLMKYGYQREELSIPVLRAGGRSGGRRGTESGTACDGGGRGHLPIP